VEEEAADALEVAAQEDEEGEAPQSEEVAPRLIVVGAACFCFFLALSMLVSVIFWLCLCLFLLFSGFVYACFCNFLALSVLQSLSLCSLADDPNQTGQASRCVSMSQHSRQWSARILMRRFL